MEARLVKTMFAVVVDSYSIVICVTTVYIWFGEYEQATRCGYAIGMTGLIVFRGNRLRRIEGWAACKLYGYLFATIHCDACFKLVLANLCREMMCRQRT